MIIRAAPLIDKSQPDTVFVKLAKSGQDISLDMPVFGLDTLIHLQQAGIEAVCLDGAGSCWLIRWTRLPQPQTRPVSLSGRASLPEEGDDQPDVHPCWRSIR